MSRVEIERLRRAVTQLETSYERALEQIEERYANRIDVPLQEVRGQGREIALEAHARAYLLDHLLNALGWKVCETDLMLIEDAVDSIAEVEGHQRRLDYHGREHDNGRSLLIVESKRPSVQLPASRDGDISGLLGKALKQIQLGSKISVSILWAEILKSAKSYVSRVTTTTGRAPERFVISNGEWFAVFTDVNATLLAQEQESATITIFRDLSDVMRRLDEFYQLLSYQTLSGYIPPQHPAAVTEFVPDQQEVLCARVVDVDYVRYGERQPMISLRVGIWVRTTQGAWVFFNKEYSDPFLILSDDKAKLEVALSGINQRAGDLITALSSDRRIRFLTQTEIEEYPPPMQGSGQFGKRQSPLFEAVGNSASRTKRYRVITTDKIHHLADDNSFDQCPYHEWGGCKPGDRAGSIAITAPSCEPPCFFPSGSPFHCAHASVHTGRRNKCLLLAFEEFLCCRRCTFLDRCWPDKSAMPCLK